MLKDFILARNDFVYSFVFSTHLSAGSSSKLLDLPSVVRPLATAFEVAISRYGLINSPTAKTRQKILMYGLSQVCGVIYIYCGSNSAWVSASYANQCVRIEAVRLGIEQTGPVTTYLTDVDSQNSWSASPSRLLSWVLNNLRDTLLSLLKCIQIWLMKAELL